MTFSLSIIYTNTPAYYEVSTDDFYFFSIKLKSYKGYQSYVPDLIEIKIEEEKQIFKGNYNTGKTKVIWKLISCSSKGYDTFIKEVAHQIELWMKNNVVRWAPG